MGLTGMDEQVLEALGKEHRITEMDVGSDAILKKKGMRFHVRRFSIESVGNLCIMDMTAMFGLMKMQTIILSADEKDVPLMDLDIVKAMGKMTWIVELYDTEVSFRNDGLLERCGIIKEKDSDLEDHVTGKYWFDDLRYPCSYSKKTKGYSKRAEMSCRGYIDAYMDELKKAPVCDREKKRKKIAYFAEGLYKSDGPAVSQMKRLFGEETAKRLVLGHMYNVGD
ncbi:MAG: hypothetical protein IKI62_04990 [Clostridia bacterium]|nr:hypothetical protein [Clostridia bacterium]